MSMAFDGASTWWGRDFISVAVSFKLGSLRIRKMVALIEKIAVTTAQGAESYVEAIAGLVEDIRALQRRQGEPDCNLLSVYDFVVWMVGNCPENVGTRGGVCTQLNMQQQSKHRS
jgi:hypothetical protein